MIKIEKAVIRLYLRTCYFCDLVQSFVKNTYLGSKQRLRPQDPQTYAASIACKINCALPETMRLWGRTLDKRWYSLRPNPSYPIRHVSTHRSFHPAVLVLWLCSRGTARSTWRQSQEQSSFRVQTTKLRRLRYTQPLRPAEAGFCVGISLMNFISDAKRYSREVPGTGFITTYLVLRYGTAF